MYMIPGDVVKLIPLPKIAEQEVKPTLVRSFIRKRHDIPETLFKHANCKKTIYVLETYNNFRI